MTDKEYFKNYQQEYKTSPYRDLAIFYGCVLLIVTLGIFMLYRAKARSDQRIDDAIKSLQISEEAAYQQQLKEKQQLYQIWKKHYKPELTYEEWELLYRKGLLKFESK